MHLVINPASPEQTLIDRVVAALRAGRVIAYPTDTLYALGADPRSLAAVNEIFRIKGRDARSSLPLIAASVEQARAAVDLGPAGERLAARFWPGPLTIVAAQRAALAEGVGAAGTIAVRVPDHALARALARGLEFPVISTSANRSGEPAAGSAGEVAVSLGNVVALIVDGGPAPGGLPSTIVALTGGMPRLVRAGAVPWERVLESLE